jgi:hypothetical protein
MNTQLSPEEIQKYKQQMMNMYQGAGQSQGGSITKSQKITAAPATAPAPATVTAPAATAPAPATTAPTANAPATTAHAVTTPATAPTAQRAQKASGTRFQLPNESFLESLKNPDPEPEYTGRNARIQTPDTGAISAPGVDSSDGTDMSIAPAPKPPAGGTYYPDTGAIGVPNYPGTPDTGPIAATPIAPPSVQVPDTGVIAAPDFPEETMGTGYLRVQVHTANRAIPVPDAMLIITEETPLGRKLVRMNITDENGYSDLIPLEVPVYPLDEFPNPENKPYRDYRLSAFADGYYIVPRIEVPIFSDVKSLQSVEMVPLAENTSPLSLFPSSTSGSDTAITSVEFEQN